MTTADLKEKYHGSLSIGQKDQFQSVFDVSQKILFEKPDPRLYSWEIYADVKATVASLGGDY